MVASQRRVKILPSAMRPAHSTHRNEPSPSPIPNTIPNP